jgi:hypothetical protein
LGHISLTCSWELIAYGEWWTKQPASKQQNAAEDSADTMRSVDKRFGEAAPTCAGAVVALEQRPEFAH